MNGAPPFFCPQDTFCFQITDPKHVSLFRHHCPHGPQCLQQADPFHFQNFVHSPAPPPTSAQSFLPPASLPPCPQGSLCQHINNIHHTAQYNHPCASGFQCPFATDPKHAFNFTHVPPQLPSYPPISSSGFGGYTNYAPYTLPQASMTPTLPPCKFGGQCRMLERNDLVHMSRWGHPSSSPPTPSSSSSSPGPGHTHHAPGSSFPGTPTQPQPCRHGGDCRMLARGEADHISRYTHPAPTIKFKGGIPLDMAYFIDDKTAGKNGFAAKGGGVYVEKLLTKGTEDYNVFEKAYHQFCGGASVPIKNVYWVQNQSMAQVFSIENGKTARRIATNPAAFKKDDWKTMDRVPLRTWVHSNAQTKIADCVWNAALTKDQSPVMMACHGTTDAYARQIIDVGFASLSLLDPGWFGKGMYFTTSATYAKSYTSGKSNTVLVICLITPGNVFPVVENTKEAGTLMGKPCKNGYASHYVCTSGGQPVTATTTSYHDEIVVFQESQALPVYIVELA